MKKTVALALIIMSAFLVLLSSCNKNDKRIDELSNQVSELQSKVDEKDSSKSKETKTEDENKSVTDGKRDNNTSNRDGSSQTKVATTNSIKKSPSEVTTSPISATAMITFKLPSTNSTMKFEVYVANELYEAKVLKCDGSNYSQKLIGLGGTKAVLCTLNGITIYTCNVNFEKNPATITNAKYYEFNSVNTDPPIQHTTTTTKVTTELVTENGSGYRLCLSMKKDIVAYLTSKGYVFDDSIDMAGWIDASNIPTAYNKYEYNDNLANVKKSIDAMLMNKDNKYTRFSVLVWNTYGSSSENAKTDYQIYWQQNK